MWSKVQILLSARGNSLVVLMCLLRVGIRLNRCEIYIRNIARLIERSAIEIRCSYVMESFLYIGPLDVLKLIIRLNTCGKNIS